MCLRSSEFFFFACRFCEQTSDLFQDPTLPFHLDIGCARGGFCMKLAATRPDLNVLGLEIRRPVAAFCTKRAIESGLPNVGFVSCNANVDLDRILQGIKNASSQLARVSIQFPDPHFKARHQKRRVVQPALVQAIVDNTDSDCDVFIQSDILDVAMDMRLQFRDHSGFVEVSENIDVWMPENPTGIPTEREVGVLEKGLPVYRTQFRRRMATSQS
jgi:tRNA (guanine-N7-)-methyltransferase